MAQPLDGRRHRAISYNPGTSSNRGSQTTSTHPQPNPRPHSGVSQPPLRIVNRVAPTRICDNGGWTDTWFAGHKHTRSVQHDLTQWPTGAPIESAIAGRLTEIVHRATLTQISLYHALGLRTRTLTLPVIVALVLILIW